MAIQTIFCDLNLLMNETLPKMVNPVEIIHLSNVQQLYFLLFQLANKYRYLCFRSKGDLYWPYFNRDKYKTEQNVDTI